MSLFVKDLISLRDRFKAMSADLSRLFVDGSPIPETTYQLGVDLDKAITRRTTVMYTETTEEMTKFLEGVVGVIEGDDFAYHALWQLNKLKDHLHLTWEQPRNEMSSVVVGQIEDRPINVQLRIAVIGGHRIVFAYGCSTVVDYDMVRNFFNVAMPATARDEDGRVRSANADNWTNAIPSPWTKKETT